MTTYGLTETGFVKKRQPVIRAELETSFRTIFGNEINLLPTSIFGQTIGIYSEREALLWELAEELYNSAFPDTASGVSLDNAAALTGATRLAATFSQVTVRVVGTLGTYVPIGLIFSVENVPTSRFITVFDGTIAAGLNEKQKLVFSAVPAAGQWQITFDGQTTAVLAFNESNANIQTALNALSNLSGVIVTGSYTAGLTIEFAGSDGQKEQPAVTITGSTLVDGASNPITVTIEETVKGWLPFVDVLCRAQNTGAIAAPAGTLTVIETPIFGVDSVVNLLDANVGRELETDAELRLRRLESLQRAGTATVNGIVTTLRQVSGVTNAFVIENNQDTVDGDGRPPHSYEAYVDGGEDQDILDTIWETKPAGIETVGNFSGNVIDSQGFVQVVKFSRPTTADIWLEVDITKNTDPSETGGVYPANGDDLVRDAVLSYGNTFEIGQDVVLVRFFNAINGIPGVLGIVIRAGFAPNPTGTVNLAIGPTELAKFDASRLEVTSA
jgi:uncharacterized phage protein gp47/JayE